MPYEGPSVAQVLEAGTDRAGVGAGAGAGAGADAGADVL
jgi:hypothetical protein